MFDIFLCFYNSVALYFILFFWLCLCVKKSHRTVSHYCSFTVMVMSHFWQRIKLNVICEWTSYIFHHNFKPNILHLILLFVKHLNNIFYVWQITIISVKMCDSWKSVVDLVFFYFLLVCSCFFPWFCLLTAGAHPNAQQSLTYSLNYLTATLRQCYSLLFVV